GSSAPGIDYSEDAEATAGYGNLHAFVDGTALANTGVNSEGNGNAIASALASWDDSVLVSVPSRSNNARITFHTSLMVHGTLGASASASPAELEVIIPCTPTGICVHQSMSGGSAGATVTARVNNKFGVTASGLRFEDSTGFDQENDLPAVIP